MCLVEVEIKGLKHCRLLVFTRFPRIGCSYLIPTVRQVRKTMVELLLSDHHRECTTCIRNPNCELQNLADNLGIRNIKYTGEMRPLPIQNENPFIIRDYNKCIKCRRCEAICSKVQEVNVYSALNRGFDTVIALHLCRTFLR